MNEQDRELVLKYLCAMLPYRVKLHNITTNEDVELYAVDLNSRMASFWKFKGNSLQIGDISSIFRGDGSIRLKPYLRPMSSMTREEKLEYISIIDATRWTTVGLEEKIILSIDLVECKAEDGTPDNIYNIIQMAPIDWLLKKHFDIRGLIYRGLAIEVTEDNNPYKL